MNRRFPQPRAETSALARAHEAKLLSVMLRTSRLTWVFGQPEADKSTLLKTCVLPLLQRRGIDRGAATPPTAAWNLTTPDRRHSSIARQSHPRIEAAIYFDSWSDAPLTLLKRRIVQIVPAASHHDSIVSARLADLLQRLDWQFGVHFIFLIDHFEAYLAMAPETGEIAQFANELVEAVLHKDVRANFLVAMDEAARSRLERFRLRMPGFDQNFLRVSSPPTSPANAVEGETHVTGIVAHASPAPSATAAVERLRRRPVSGTSIKVEDIYAFIEAKLAKTTAQIPIALGQSTAHMPARPAPKSSSQRGVPGTAPMAERALTEVGDATDEDSFFSFAHKQRQRSHNKKLQEHGLAAALAWLKKR